jgi:hypothetical protein
LRERSSVGSLKPRRRDSRDHGRSPMRLESWWQIPLKSKFSGSVIRAG